MWLQSGQWGVTNLADLPLDGLERIDVYRGGAPAEFGTAGVGGIILASRLRSVDTATGGGNLMLNAIAAAVIGGTSLFGGVGFVMSALLGGLIIAAVENGMGLLGLPSGVKFVVNGLVLLAAVLIDALSRRRRESSGIV